MTKERWTKVTESDVGGDQIEYGPEDLEGWDSRDELGDAGFYPYTRGPYPSMYTGRLWTMRQYAGFGDAAATNARFRALLDAGQTGISVAFDLPTQMGLDSDDPLAAGEVGKVGVAIDSVEDMRVLFDGIPLGEVSTSMTINSTAAVLLLMYQIVAEGQGADPAQLRGTVQNDILKEYIARGTYISLEHDLDLRVSHSRSRLNSSPGGRLHHCERPCLCRRGEFSRIGRRHFCPPALILLERALRPLRGGGEVQGGQEVVGALDA